MFGKCEMDHTFSPLLLEAGMMKNRVVAADQRRIATGSQLRPRYLQKEILSGHTRFS